MNALDLDTIAELQSLLGDDFQLFLNTFRQDLAARKATIAQAIADNSAEVVRLAAHSLKGSTSNLGADELCQACSKLELEAHKGNLSQAKVLFAEIEKNSQLVLEALQQFNKSN